MEPHFLNSTKGSSAGSAPIFIKNKNEATIDQKIN